MPMNEEFIQQIAQKHRDCRECPSRDEVGSFFNRLVGLLFPVFSDIRLGTEDEVQAHIKALQSELEELVWPQQHKDATAQERAAEHNPGQVTLHFFEQIPEIYRLLLQDVDAIYNGDPAANSREEVVRSYPGFYAVAAYRFAHQLHLSRVPIIPRMITEHAHSITGIDIHPGATIGHHFCIDHGTGVVIGETTRIGNHVKIYQGVTLGALSVDKSDAKTKRHPTIGDHVVIYAGATILGGSTVIGEHSVIGGNVWITRSVEPRTQVHYKHKVVEREDENAPASEIEPADTNIHRKKE